MLTARVFPLSDSPPRVRICGGVSQFGSMNLLRGVRGEGEGRGTRGGWFAELLRLTQGLLRLGPR